MHTDFPMPYTQTSVSPPKPHQIGFLEPESLRNHLNRTQLVITPLVASTLTVPFTNQLYFIFH